MRCPRFVFSCRSVWSHTSNDNYLPRTHINRPLTLHRHEGRPLRLRDARPLCPLLQRGHAQHRSVAVQPLLSTDRRSEIVRTLNLLAYLFTTQNNTTTYPPYTRVRPLDLRGIALEPVVPLLRDHAHVQLHLLASGICRCTDDSADGAHQSISYTAPPHLPNNTNNRTAQGLDPETRCYFPRQYLANPGKYNRKEICLVWSPLGQQII